MAHICTTSMSLLDGAWSDNGWLGIPTIKVDSDFSFSIHINMNNDNVNFVTKKNLGMTRILSLFSIINDLSQIFAFIMITQYCHFLNFSCRKFRYKIIQ